MVTDMLRSAVEMRAALDIVADAAARLRALEMRSDWPGYLDANEVLARMNSLQRTLAADVRHAVAS